MAARSCALPLLWALAAAHPRDSFTWQSATASIGATDPSTDCRVAALAYRHALQLQQDRAPLRHVHDALQLSAQCGQPAPTAVPRRRVGPAPPTGSIYVDYAGGDDHAAGTERSPLKTLAAALERCRATEIERSVVLRGGVHYLSATLTIDQRLNGLTIVGFPGENAWLSGGRVVAPSWRRAQGLNVSSAYVAALPGLSSVPGLNKLNYEDPQHARMVRAAVETDFQPNLTGRSGRGTRTGWSRPARWSAAC